MLFRNIQRACVLKDDCTRRDCDRKRTAQCVACKKAGYCSVDCQKRFVDLWFSAFAPLMASGCISYRYRDWPEHKMACKLEIKG